MTDYTSLLKRLTPRGSATVIAGVSAYLPKYFADYAINSKLRQAHFLAQAAHESDSFKTLHEYASGAAYEGRKNLGNTQPGDGKRYKGRGIFQLTGRANYKLFGKLIGQPLEAQPDLAATPENSVHTACAYWDQRKLSALADKDDVRGVTKKINGGYNGLAQREAFLTKAKALLNDKTDAEVSEELKAEQKKAEDKRNTSGTIATTTGTIGGSQAPTQLPADPGFDWHTLLYVGAAVAVVGAVVYFAIKAYNNHQRAAAYREASASLPNAAVAKET